MSIHRLAVSNWRFGPQRRRPLTLPDEFRQRPAPPILQVLAVAGLVLLWPRASPAQQQDGDCGSRAAPMIAMCGSDTCSCADRCEAGDECTSGCCANGFCAPSCVCHEQAPYYYCGSEPGCSANHRSTSRLAPEALAWTTALIALLFLRRRQHRQN